MKSTAPLILSFFLCTLCYAQQKHISDFVSLDPGIQDENFNIPFSHTFQYLIGKGDPLDSGGTMPGNLDFTGYVPKEGSSKSGYLSVNSELIPKGAVTILDIEFDDVSGKWIVDNSQAVDFSFNLPAENPENTGGFDYGVGSTVANCSGTVTPWNTIITCEEWTNKDVINNISIDETLIKVDGIPDGYDAYGWAIEINPATKTIVNRDTTRIGPDKLWAMGNFKHENAVIHHNERTVYQGADDTKGEGYLFKFVADVDRNLYSGKLYVYRKINTSTGEWILLDNTTISERNTTLEQCANVGATNFDGIEDVEISPLDGMVYFAVKGDGKVYRFTDSDPVSGTTVTNFETYVGGMSYEVKPNVNVAWGSGNDNLVFDDLGNLWVAQDGSFSGGDNNYIWVVENGHTEANPKVKIFARTPEKSEPTGLTFSPDFRYIFMSIQHPDASNSLTTQVDAGGQSVAFDKDITLVIGRKEHLGNDLTLEDQDIMISQYYHDEASDSKWIEVKNITENSIPGGTYFLDLYDSASLQNMSTALPKATQTIPAMAAGEVRLFKNRENPDLPQSGYLGDAIQQQSDVCNFDGDDMILITTTPGKRKYTNRKDILGIVPAGSWGSNTTLVRGGNSLELPEKDFDPNNWIELDSLQEVSLADKNKNIALGTHVTGPTKWNGTSWDRLEPDRTRITEINGEYVGGQKDFAAYDLKINETGSFKFGDDSNNNVFVHRNLTIDPNGSLIIGDTESLIIKNTSATVTGSIEKIEKSTPRNHVNDITYWSSPVQDEQIEKVFDDVDPERIFYFDQARHLINDPSDDTYWNVWVVATGEMEVGKGYAAEGGPLGETGSAEISFKGTPNYGPISTTGMYFNDDEGINIYADHNDYNLIGNPYPAAIDIEAFLIENMTVIDGTAYFWNHSSGLVNGKYSQDDYVTYNRFASVPEVGKNIGSGQGFFVRAIKNQAVVFNQDMILASDNAQFFKGTKKKGSIEKNSLRINLKGSDNSFKQIVIGFDEKMTDQMDSGYDALYLKGNQPIALYSILDKSKLSIQVLGPFNEQKIVNLGFDADVEGLEMTLELSRKEGLLRDQDILLLDNDNGMVHDLNSSPYTFSYKGKGSFEDRFSLVFNSTVLVMDEDNIVEDAKVYMKDQYLIIEAQHLIEQIKVYDALGRLVHKEILQSTYSELNLDRIKIGSFFIVELVDGEGKTLTRKMIKY